MINTFILLSVMHLLFQWKTICGFCVCPIFLKIPNVIIFMKAIMGKKRIVVFCKSVTTNWSVVPINIVYHFRLLLTYISNASSAMCQGLRGLVQRILFNAVQIKMLHWPLERWEAWALGEERWLPVRDQLSKQQGKERRQPGAAKGGCVRHVPTEAGRNRHSAQAQEPLPDL